MDNDKNDEMKDFMDRIKYLPREQQEQLINEFNKLMYQEKYLNNNNFDK